MAASSSRVLRWTPRRSCFSVRAANKRSRALYRDDAVIAAANARQHDAGPLREGLRGRRTARPALQRLAFFVGERQRGLRSSSAHRRPPRVHGERLAEPLSFTISDSGHTSREQPRPYLGGCGTGAGVGTTTPGASGISSTSVTFVT